MKLFYFTFGQRYKHQPHPTVGALAHPDGWFTIEAPNHGQAVTRMFEICGKHWANVYDTEPDLKTFPQGELARYSIDITKTLNPSLEMNPETGLFEEDNKQ